MCVRASKRQAAGGSGELTGAMLGDEAIAAGVCFGGANAGAWLMTMVGMLLGRRVGDGGVDAERGGVSGDGGSGRFAAWSRTAATAPASSSRRSDAGAVPAEKSGGDDAVGVPACGGSDGDWLPPPARTNRSTSDGRAFNRGRNPSCIQGKAPGNSSAVERKMGLLFAPPNLVCAW